MLTFFKQRWYNKVNNCAQCVATLEMQELIYIFLWNRLWGYRFMRKHNWSVFLYLLVSFWYSANERMFLIPFFLSFERNRLIGLKTATHFDPDAHFIFAIIFIKNIIITHNVYFEIENNYYRNHDITKLSLKRMNRKPRSRWLG